MNTSSTFRSMAEAEAFAERNKLTITKTINALHGVEATFLPGRAPQPLTDLPLTGWDLDQALAVVWAALERLTLSDPEQDHLNTAMAWLKDAAEEYPG